MNSERSVIEWNTIIIVVNDNTLRIANQITPPERLLGSCGIMKAIEREKFHLSHKKTLRIINCC